ncbi:hypothetical protein CONLIGDRAFT_638579 [Coniochaeta ligniaria NRRL 30616]|uniref:Uncharacterized protein n=1 Tax=Coniochaeta ligniaria NRRL 30616 TaxID=1408157 RepID=A0A1J7IX03_9PEZI|nr:hypothetical protein CONLIGDRAFT_638579 [Coniochaeta ligniaria NRRL 30616]
MNTTGTKIKPHLPSVPNPPQKQKPKEKSTYPLPPNPLPNPPPQNRPIPPPPLHRRLLPLPFFSPSSRPQNPLPHKHINPLPHPPHKTPRHSDKHLRSVEVSGLEYVGGAEE